MLKKDRLKLSKVRLTTPTAWKQCTSMEECMRHNFIPRDPPPREGIQEICTTMRRMRRFHCHLFSRRGWTLPFLFCCTQSIPILRLIYDRGVHVFEGGRRTFRAFSMGRCHCKVPLAQTCRFYVVQDFYALAFHRESSMGSPSVLSFDVQFHSIARASRN